MAAGASLVWIAVFMEGILAQWTLGVELGPREPREADRHAARRRPAALFARLGIPQARRAGTRDRPSARSRGPRSALFGGVESARQGSRKGAAVLGCAGSFSPRDRGGAPPGRQGGGKGN